MSAPVAPVAIVRQPWARVNISGFGDVVSSPLTDGANPVQSPTNVGFGVLAIDVQYGFDLLVAEATVTCTDRPYTFNPDGSKNYVSYGTVIQIFAGVTGSPGLGQGLRFQGMIVEYDYTAWPKSVDIVCRGWLYAAQKFQLGSNITTVGDLFPDNGGLDLSNAGAGATDGSPIGIVTSILQICRVQGFNGGAVPNVIDGTGKLFGKVCPESVRWAEGQSGLDAIGMFDDICLGYRTFDQTQGVVRQKISATPAPDNIVTTFTEGVDILSGTGQYSILDTCGTFLVTGGTKTANNATNAAFQYPKPGFGAPAPLNPYTDAPEQTSSPLLEKSLTTDAGEGLSCQEVAEWRKAEMDRALAQVTFDTPRDVLIQPGDTIRILGDPTGAPSWRLGATAELYWVQNVTTNLTEEGVFTQTLTCIGTAL